MLDEINRKLDNRLQSCTTKGGKGEAMNITEVLETIMLVCFGVSWPVNLVKNFKLRSAKSTSLTFLLLIWLGYVAGVSAKILQLVNPALKNPSWYLLTIYIINLVMLSANLVVYYRNQKLDERSIAAR